MGKSDIVNCKCGGHYREDGIYRHNKTERHLNFVNNGIKYTPPEKKIKTIVDLNCESCDMQFKNQAGAKSHYKTSKHAKFSAIEGGIKAFRKKALEECNTEEDPVNKYKYWGKTMFHN